MRVFPFPGVDIVRRVEQDPTRSRGEVACGAVRAHVSALIGFMAVGLACAGNAFASSASPNPVGFGNVPINTTVSSR